MRPYVKTIFCRDESLTRPRITTNVDAIALRVLTRKLDITRGSIYDWQQLNVNNPFCLMDKATGFNNRDE